MNSRVIAGRPHYDAIVLGLGGVGSAALYHLAHRGLRVLGLDRFPPGHDRGSSHGETRIIRQAYFEHPDYVPLLLRAYELWQELESRRRERLFVPCGLVQVGPIDGEVVPGVLKSASLHRLPVERLLAREAAARFPALRFPNEHEAVFEPKAGYLLVEKCVAAHLEVAQRAGAELRTGAAVLEWRPAEESSSDAMLVATAEGEYTADALVVTAGAWAAGHLAPLAGKLRVLRKPLHWFACDDDRYGASCPAYLYETAKGVYYGFPRIEGSVKVARHDAGEEVLDPLTVSRELDLKEFDTVKRFVADYLPGVAQRAIDHATCLYTMSPDGQFIVDRLPGRANVCFAAGLSGHGFKFTSVLGEILAKLACGEGVGLPIEFLGLSRLE
jgi:sarcosine oxidase